jgi:hypothetical protein
MSQLVQQGRFFLASQKSGLLTRYLGKDYTGEGAFLNISIPSCLVDDLAHKLHVMHDVVSSEPSYDEYYLLRSESIIA